MCLTTHDKFAVKAQSDIICYKIVNRTRGMRRGKYKSFWQGFRYQLGEEYHEERFEDTPRFRDILRVIGVYDVYFGFHSYVNDPIGYLARENDVVIKCVIPKGTLMYTSYNNEQYCSQDIRLVAQWDKKKKIWVENFD